MQFFHSSLGLRTHPSAVQNRYVGLDYVRLVKTQ